MWPYFGPTILVARAQLCALAPSMPAQCYEDRPKKRAPIWKHQVFVCLCEKINRKRLQNKVSGILGYFVVFFYSFLPQVSAYNGHYRVRAINCHNRRFALYPNRESLQ